MRISAISATVLVAFAMAAAAHEGQVEIGPTQSFPITIDQAGSYLLTTDLDVASTTANGIEINASDVTLDLGGHVIRGPGAAISDSYGIYSQHTVHSVTVHNGTVTAFHRGIYLGSSDIANAGGHRLFDLTASHCGMTGIIVDHAVVRDCIVHNNGETGFNGSQCVAENIVASGNGGGISIMEGSCERCVANDNGFGFWAQSATLTGCQAANNSQDGFSPTVETVMVGCVATENSGVGFNLQADGSNNLVNCTADRNTGGNIVNCGVGNGCHQNYLP